MTVLEEGELAFTFGSSWHVERFDVPGRKLPKGVSPVDFVVESHDEIVLVEIKDPSAAGSPEAQRAAFAQKMQTKKLTHEELTPKARSTYSFLHLMKRDTKPIRYVVVIGLEKLSIQPPLLQNFTDRLRKRLRHEVDEPWQREYIASCAVVSIADLAKVMPGCSASRVPKP